MIICQDRLGTNIRKMLIKLPPAHTHTPGSRRPINLYFTWL